ncbi:MAG: NADH-quinone oxidoreductase subunit J [Methanomassiliicoccaceae archaeon]|jgi:NADH-quinone oxidoreductase subunit J|nr:NADH-quinone oxidoreductase subunit J [Methanomassiliicoccaceae archaeon]
MGVLDKFASWLGGVIDGAWDFLGYLLDNLDMVAFLCIIVIAVASAVFVVISKEAMHSAFYLALTTVCVAITYFFLEAEFVGIVQLMVYTCAVTIVFAFSIMLTRSKIMGDESDE